MKVVVERERFDAWWHSLPETSWNNIDSKWVGWWAALSQPAEAPKTAAWTPCFNCCLDSTGKMTHSYGCPNDPTRFKATPAPAEAPEPVGWISTKDTSHGPSRNLWPKRYSDDDVPLYAASPAPAVPPGYVPVELVNALLHQIDIGDYIDSLGHSAKMLKAVHDLMKYTAAPPAPAVPLTDEQTWLLWKDAIDICDRTGRLAAFAYKDAIERAHGITGDET